ncbi:hypothetical protein Hanom_Chr08g00758941 [Helianthus anomalus]
MSESVVDLNWVYIGVSGNTGDVFSRICVLLVRVMYKWFCCFGLGLVNFDLENGFVCSNGFLWNKFQIGRRKNGQLRFVTRWVDLTAVLINCFKCNTS